MPAACCGVALAGCCLAPCKNISYLLFSLWLGPNGISFGYATSRVSHAASQDVRQTGACWSKLTCSEAKQSMLLNSFSCLGLVMRKRPACRMLYTQRRHERVPAAVTPIRLSWCQSLRRGLVHSACSPGTVARLMLLGAFEQGSHLASLSVGKA